MIGEDPQDHIFEWEFVDILGVAVIKYGHQMVGKLKDWKRGELISGMYSLYSYNLRVLKQHSDNQKPIELSIHPTGVPYYWKCRVLIRIYGNRDKDSMEVEMNFLDTTKYDVSTDS